MAKSRRRFNPAEHEDSLQWNLNCLEAAEELDTNRLLADFVVHSVERGIISEEMIPLASAYIQARLDELDAAPAAGIGPEIVAHRLAITQVSTLATYIPASAGSLLVEHGTGAYLGLNAPAVSYASLGLPLASMHASIGEWIEDDFETLAIESVLEFLALLFILGGVPGGKAAKKSWKEVAEKAAKNKNIMKVLRELIEHLFKYRAKSRGEWLKKIFELLKKLAEEMGKADLIEEALRGVLTGMTGWGIFMMLLEILLIFTPLGWGKKVAEILLLLGTWAYHLHHKYEVWEKARKLEKEAEEAKKKAKKKTKKKAKKKTKKKAKK